MNDTILVVDDDASIRFALSEALKKGGHPDVDTASSAEEALTKASRTNYDVILLDVRLPGMSGIEAIEHIRKAGCTSEIIVMTAHGSKDVALTAVRKGAYDFFSKPFSIAEMGIIVRRALEKRRLQNEVRALRQKLSRNNSARHIIGESQAIRQVIYQVEKIAPLEATTLITGESGTGKELVADLVHSLSKRADKPFIKINCAAIPDTLLESELFGYEKGAFTGAAESKPGKFQLANGGTIHLDEIGDMPLGLQAKLLRVIEQKTIERLGGRETLSLDTRIIATTNQDLNNLVTDNKFRGDLYHRLNVAQIHIPPLRERKEDIPSLVEHFTQEIKIKHGLDFKGISKEAMAELFAYHWPGNVRELANTLERAMILASEPILSANDISAAMRGRPKYFETGTESAMSLNETLQMIERQMIQYALRKNKGVQTAAARDLGLSAKNMWKKINKHQIVIDHYRRHG